MMDTKATNKKSRKSSAAKKPSSDDFRDVRDEDLNQDLFDKNIEAFEKHNSHIAGMLKSVTAAQSKLIINEHGEYDIKFRDIRLYNQGAATWSEERMEAFDRKDGVHQLLISPPDSSNLDDESNVTGYRIIKRATESGINFLTAPNTPHCFHLVAFGIGLGLYIPALAEKTQCRHIVFVEPNIEFAYHSLFVFDWSAFFEDMDAEGRHHSFVFLNTGVQISEEIRDNIRYINPAFIDGTIFFKTYPSSIMSNALDILIRDRDTIGTGLGFLEDEIDMVRNSYNNLVKFNGRHFKQSDDIVSVPVFIIGGGPSLDNDLEFIRNNQDRAIIISCGTAIRILLKNGITPDFQMEMENVPTVTRLMGILAKDHDLSKIKLLASSTIDPGVSAYFDEVIYYFRASLASFPIFNQGSDTLLTYATPTVSNLGLSFAQSVGCREFYLFGIDLGARDPEKHHAKDAAYNQGEVKFSTVIDVPHPANFGGEVLTEMIYQWARQTMELAITYNSTGRAYYNCSDGCRIQHSVPRLSSTIKLPDAPTKGDVLQEILHKFPDYTQEMFDTSWTKRNFRKRLDDFTDVMIKVIEGNEPTEEDSLRPQGKKASAEPNKPDPTLKKDGVAQYDLQFAMDICRTLIPADGETSAETHFFRGSTLMCFAMINYYYNRLVNEEHREIFIQIVQEELVYQFQRTKKRVHKFYNKLEGIDSGEDEDAPLPDTITESG